MLKKLSKLLVTPYWTMFVVWVITLYEVISKKESFLLDVRNWIIIVVGGIFIFGALSAWSMGRKLNDFKD